MVENEYGEVGGGAVAEEHPTLAGFGQLAAAGRKWAGVRLQWKQCNGQSNGCDDTGASGLALV